MSDHPQEHEEQPDEQGGQVSEVSGMGESPEPISPGDATAGYPPSESGEADEGTAGPNAAPRHDPPEPENESAH